MAMPSAVILQLGALQLRWYGVFAALAALVAYLLAAWRAPRYGMTRNDAADIMLVAMVTGLVGARLEYARRFWSDGFSDNWLSIFQVWQGGLVFQGGFVLALVALWWLGRRRGWRTGDLGDLMAVALPGGHAVARIGCLLNGCCFGRPWDHALAVRYPATGNDVLSSQIINGFLPPDSQSPLPVVPVQALETLMCLALAALALLLERRGLLRRQRFTLYMLLYAIGRFALEFLRGDYHRLSGLTPAQVTCIAVVLPLTVAVIAYSSFRSRRLAGEKPSATTGADHGPRRKHRH